MKKLIVLLLLLVSCQIAMGQMKIMFDFSNVDQTMHFLKKPNINDSDIDSLVNTPGLKAIEQKIHANDSIAREALHKISKGIKLIGKEADFQYDFIKDHLAELEQFAQTIKSNRQRILDSINKLADYIPLGKTLKVRVNFLLGSYSSGFTLGDDSTFYIGMHHFKNDLAGIICYCQHELFHNIQSLIYNRDKIFDLIDKAKDTATLNAYFLAANLFVEGSAEYVADYETLDQSNPFIKEQTDHIRVNRQRMSDVFYLIDRTLLDTYNNPAKANLDNAYSILFDWNWNNPGYAAGKYMLKVLVKAYGKDMIKKYLAADPMVFVKDYTELTKTNKKAYPFQFSDEFERIIDVVIARVNVLKTENNTNKK